MIWEVVPRDDGDRDRDAPRKLDQEAALAHGDEDLPVVARLVVEIRSDGRRTVARGAMEDIDGQRVAVEATGTTPLSLARQLAGAIWKLPRLPRPSWRALLPGRRRDPDK